MIPSRLQMFDVETRIGSGGFVRLVDVMGDDAAVVQAARVSFGNGTKSRREDRSLIRYLVRHRHTTPLEMCELKLHVRAPVFAARQWMRHRTASINERSARYSVMPEEFANLSAEDWREQSSSNKQGSGPCLPPEVAALAAGTQRAAYKASARAYRRLLEVGSSRELARTVLPVGTYTEWFWKIDLHNLLHFLKLRMDPHAQKEIRDFAEHIGRIVAEWVPEVWWAWENYVRYAHTFSANEMELLARLVKAAPGVRMDPDFKRWRKEMGLLAHLGSSRERRAFWAAIDLDTDPRVTINPRTSLLLVGNEEACAISKMPELGWDLPCPVCGGSAICSDTDCEGLVHDGDPCFCGDCGYLSSWLIDGTVPVIAPPGRGPISIIRCIYDAHGRERLLETFGSLDVSEAFEGEE